MIERFLVNGIGRTKEEDEITHELVDPVDERVSPPRMGPGWEQSFRLTSRQGNARANGGRRTVKITSVLVSSTRPTCDDQARTGKNHSPRVRRSLTSCRVRRITRALRIVRTARTWPSNAAGRREGGAAQGRSEAKLLRLSHAF